MKCTTKSGSLAVIHSRKLFEKNIPSDYIWKLYGWLADDLSMYVAREHDSFYHELRDVIRSRSIEAYDSFYVRWGRQCIGSAGNLLASQRHARWVLVNFLKKYDFDSNKEQKVLTAVNKFYFYEESCRNLNYSILRKVFPWDVYIKEFFRILLGEVLPPLSDVFEGSRHGPGATLSNSYKLSNVFFKYATLPYTVTKEASALARFVIEQDERWSSAIQELYRDWKGLPYNYPIKLLEMYDEIFRTVDHNRVTTVPKSYKTYRTIAIEPGLNLYLQLGLDSYLRKELFKRFQVDLRTQIHNQRLAQNGSSNWKDSDSFVTIDLEGASDTISVALLLKYLPACWVSLFLKLRSPNGVLNGQKFCYAKLSSMGNGFTFAFETAFFCSIIYAASKLAGSDLSPNDFAIYGDDIIVRKSIYSSVLDILTSCGFTVNTEKTFSEGPFRESCGSHFHNGVDLKPLYLKRWKNLSVKSLFSDINRIQRHLILYFDFPIAQSKCIQNMSKWIPERFKIFQGPYSDTEFDTYLHVSKPPPWCAYKNFVYTFQRLIDSPVQYKKNKWHDFLPRKLMHPLKDQPFNSGYTVGESDRGGYFVVTSREATMKRAFDQTSHWSDTYAR